MRARGRRHAREGLAQRIRRDDGQMMAPLVIFVGITILAFAVSILVPVGAATNERSRSQTAADAAALAGAEEARTLFVYTSTLPTILTFPLMPLPPVLGVTGSASANSYAFRNGSQVTDYRLNPSDGTVYAKVRSTTAAFPEKNPSSQPYAEADAEVEMDVDFSGCRWDDPTPPSPLPYGPPTFVRTLECGAWSATYTITNGNGYYPTISYVGTTSARLFDDLEPRIVS